MNEEAEKSPPEEELHVPKKKVELLENGDVVISTPPEFRAPTIRDTALALRAMGKKGIPLHEDHEALEGRHTDAVDAVLADHALLALELLEAIHRGDTAPLRAIADAMKDGKPTARDFHLLNDSLTRAYCRAVRKAGGTPDDETIQAELVALLRAERGGATPRDGACTKLDTLHGMLEFRRFEFTKAPRRVGRPRKR
jgi:hypothetical protein